MEKNLDIDDPSTYVEAKWKIEWEKAMVVDYDSLIKNHTWDLVPLSHRKNIVRCQWFYKEKIIIDR